MAHHKEQNAQATGELKNKTKTSIKVLKDDDAYFF